jgi:hypothetical protein
MQARPPQQVSKEADTGFWMSTVCLLGYMSEKVKAVALAAVPLANAGQAAAAGDQEGWHPDLDEYACCGCWPT